MLSLIQRTTLLSLFAVSSLGAVQVNSNEFQNNQVFGIQFSGEGRTFLGSERSVTSISMQEYITAAFRVTELNIVTNGNGLLRVYFSRPLRPGEAAQALDDAASGVTGSGASFRQPLPPGVQRMADQAAGVTEDLTSNTVIKEYPLATHARTIEYRVRKKSDLIALYNELEKHWTKEPAFFKDGQIVDPDGATQAQEEPRSLGGTLFIVGD